MKGNSMNSVLYILGFVAICAGAGFLAGVGVLLVIIGHHMEIRALYGNKEATQ